MIIAAVICAVIWFVRKGRMEERVVEKRSTAPAPSSGGIPPGLEEEYKNGVSPCESGMPVMYTLHTCRHCVHLKNFLDAHGIEHRLVYVDDFSDPARRQIMVALRSFNARGSFPTLVVPDGRSVAGFREEAVKKLFGLD